MEPDTQLAYDLFMQSPAAIVVVRGKNHVFEFTNPRYLSMVGGDKTLIGQSVGLAFPELVGQGFIKLLDNVYKTGEPYVGNEMPLELDPARNGTLVKLYLDFVYQPIKNKAGKTEAIMIHAVDVTEQVEARQKIRESESSYRTLLDSIDQGFSLVEIITDDNNKPIDYTLVEVNSVFEKQTGLKNVVGKRVKSIIPNLEDYWVENYGSVALTGKPIRFVEHSAPLGKWYSVHAFRVSETNKNLVAIMFTDVSESKAAEEALRESEQRNRTVVETLEEGVIVLDAQGGIVAANKSAEKLLGLSLKQLRGVNSLDPRWKVIDEAGNPIPGLQHTPQLVLKTKAPVTNQILGVYHANGDLFWLTANAQPIIHNSEITGVVTSFFNITKRKKVEQALQEELSITDTLTKFTNSCLFMIDNTGLVTYMNPAAEIVTGYTTKDAMGKSLHELIHHSHPDGKPYTQIQCPLNQTYRLGKASSIKEETFFKKDGTPFPALVTGTPIPFPAGGVRTTVVEFRDITEEKRNIRTLAESEERLRFMSESMPQKVFTANADGKIDYYNEEWMKFTGLSFEQIRDWGWVQFIHPEDVDENIKTWKHALKTGEPFKLEHRFKRHDGTYHWHLSRARPLRDATGNIIKWFGSNTDIEEIRNTTQRNAELEKVTKALRNQRKQLVSLNQAKDDFISLASHQLRTPASATKQFLGMVLEGYAGEVKPEQHQLLQRAHETNERQINIVNDLLNVALVDAGKIKLQKASVDLVKLIDGVLVDQASKYNAREQTVSFHHKNTEVAAKVDANRLRMVLENLMDNASKYTSEGKKITVTLVKTRLRVSINIHDEGVGMPKADMDKLFRKFSRLDNPLSTRVGGTGLGLYLVKNIIDLHGGKIDVESAPGKGSTFTVDLPL